MQKTTKRKISYFCAPVSLSAFRNKSQPAPSRSTGRTFCTSALTQTAQTLQLLSLFTMNVLSFPDGSKPWVGPAFQIFMRNARVFTNIDGKEEPASAHYMTLVPSLLQSKVEVTCYEDKTIVFCKSGLPDADAKLANKLVVKFHMLSSFPPFLLDDGNVEEMFTVGKYNEWGGEDLEPVEGFSQHDFLGSCGPLRTIELPLPALPKHPEHSSSPGKTPAKIASETI